jgi:hypothetical protein
MRGGFGGGGQVRVFVEDGVEATAAIGRKIPDQRRTPKVLTPSKDGRNSARRRSKALIG